MPELTDPDDDGILEFTQTVEDTDGDPLSITGELDQINGTTQTGSDRDPGWFSFTTSSSLSGGTRTVDVNVEIEASELGDAGTTYTFELYADDGESTSTCFFTVDVIKDLAFDGSSLFFLERDNSFLIKLVLSTGYDITTLSKDSDGSISDQYPRGFDFREDGKDLITGVQGDQDLQSYALSTAWDVNTIPSAPNSVFDISSEVSDHPNGVEVKNDGSIVIIDDNGSENFYRYDLSTAWDVASATLVNTFDTANLKNENVNYEGFYISSDGKHLYESGDNGWVRHSEFGTAWDISTLSFVNEVNITNYTDIASIVVLKRIELRSDLSSFVVDDRDNQRLLQLFLNTEGDLTTIDQNYREYGYDNEIDGTRCMGLQWGV